MRGLILLLLFALPLTADTDLYDIRIQKVVDGVYVASRAEPLRPYVEGNVTIIINERDVVVVDAGGSPRAARNVIAEIRKLTPNPVRYLVYTHIHRDHRFGTQEYLKAFPDLEIIAHPVVHEIITTNGSTFVAGRMARLEASRAELRQEIQRLRDEGKAGNEKVAAMLQRYHDSDIATIVEEYKGITNLAPTASFENRLVLHRGQRAIELRFLGRGDTDHDVIVYLPREKLVVAGDMVVHPFPYGFSTHPDEWLVTLGKLSSLDFDFLIPGHGDVQRGKTYLSRVIELVATVQKGEDLSAFEKEMAGEDPILRYYFQKYFAEPAVAEARKRR
jgi:glyoxylase-like metal-dependent hydrolase (beta-lactamase superfamily II)